jgi:subtilisin family serine protease
MRMSHRPHPRLFALLFAVFALAACSKGGGSKVVPAPSPTPTLAPGCHAVTPQSGSTYTLTSNPSGLAVQRVDASSTNCVYFTAVTTANDTPATAPHQWQYVFTPSAASPYTVNVAQTLNGNHTIFYNQAGDSSGVVSASSLQSVGRRTGASALRGTETARGIHRFSGAGVVANQLLVRYGGTAAQMRSRASQIAQAEGAVSGPELTAPAGEYERFVSVPAGIGAAAFAAKLRTQRDVLDVFPVHKRFALTKPARAVSDPHANNVDQWYLFADGFPNAWSYQTTPGSGAKIAVIDTGIDLNNTDLTQHLVFSTGYQSANHTAQDTNGHGTNVAGISSAVTNNALGFAGGGYSVSLLAYNIFPDSTAASHDQTASVTDEVSAINDAVSRGADVINLSLGAAEDYGSDNGFDQGEHDAIAAAITAGTVVVAAAGNDADGGETGTAHTVLDYPAAYDGVISVGASGLHDNNTGVFAGSTEYVTSYSQYGPALALVAPGGDPSGGNDNSPLHWIWHYSTSTANFASDQCTYANHTLPVTPTNCTAFFAGTSQATPQVSAAAALVIAQAGGHHSLSPARVAQLLEDTADNINDPHQGHGRLNIYRALAGLTGDTSAYSGPSPQKTSPMQTVAFAYDNPGGTTPHIVDVNYPSGVPVDASGNFRLGDVPTTATVYHVGVWYDANGNGVVDAGDQFGNPASTCSAAQKCTIGTITMHAVTAGFVLP